MLGEVTHPSRAERGFLRRVPDFNRDGFDLDNGNVAKAALRVSFGDWSGDELRDLPNLDEGTEGDEDLRALKVVHKQAVEGFVEMAGTLQQLGFDRSEGMDNDLRLRTAAKVLEPKLARLAETAEREIARAEAAIAAETDAIDQAATASGAGDAAGHTEIRQHWARMDSDARSRALVGDLDTTTLRALGSMPAYLSGLSEQQHAQVRALMAERVSPERTRRIRYLTAGKVLAEQAVQTYDRRARRLVDFDKARRLAEAEAALRAERTERYGVAE